MTKSGELAKQIFLAGVESVLPDRLIPGVMKLEENVLHIGDQVFPLDETGDIYVTGAGKASGVMASAVEGILGDRISGGHICVKYGHSVSLRYISITEAAHPVPDQAGFLSTASIIEFAKKAGRNDLLICLLSGGGSALLPDYPHGSNPQEIAEINNLLVRSGASIDEINTVRKHLSAVKGGQLALTAYPATVVSLLLSDVPGDRPDVIASGPTVPDPSTFTDAWGVLQKYDLIGSVPAALLQIIRRGIDGEIPDTPKPGDVIFGKVKNLIIGSNRIALENARKKAQTLGLNAFVSNEQLHGDVEANATTIVKSAIRYRDDSGMKKPLCLLYGGETTVKVSGSGLGGRNQHLALLAARLLEREDKITILAAGTDGTDGPTDAAGAVVDCNTVISASNRNIDCNSFLSQFDSYNFFSIAGGHIITGPTRTNVMDLVVVIINE